MNGVAELHAVEVVEAEARGDRLGVRRLLREIERGSRREQRSDRKRMRVQRVGNVADREPTTEHVERDDSGACGVHGAHVARTAE